uniref:KIAA0040 n=1 Tax=Junco hyemalis TaxID=40217 RepID=A0A8C5JPB0_JUNHY
MQQKISSFFNSILELIRTKHEEGVFNTVCLAVLLGLPFVVLLAFIFICCHCCFCRRRGGSTGKGGSSTQTAVSEAGTATPPLLALPWGWHSFTVQPLSKPSLLYGLKAELPHSSKMCHLPGHQTKVSCEHLRLDALSTTLETSDAMLRQHSRRMPCHLGWRQAGGRRLPDQPFCTST